MGVLEGRRALVTGASSGIGHATAVALAAEGASVAVGARRADRLTSLVADIEAAGGRAVAVDLDVTSQSSCAAAVSATVEAFGGLDLVVNNAGVMLLGPIVGADLTDWERMIGTNVLGLMYVTHAALPHLVDGPLDAPRDIVNISSVAGRVARLGSGVYNASKWAVNAFSESLRQEVTERGVRVSLVEPGAVATELTDHITVDAARAASKEFTGSIRALQSEDIARAIVYVTGQPSHVAINEVLVRPTDQTR